MTINRYRYFHAWAFDMYGDHLFAFVDRMAELDHAESTVKLYLSCINDVAKAMATARITVTVHLTPPVAGWARSSASAHAFFA